MSTSTAPTTTTNGNIQALTSVILPIMRRVMPNIIANQIVGVQPMTGPIGNIFTMRRRTNYSHRIPLKKGHFKKFLRLYDRRKFTTSDDLKIANYPSVHLLTPETRSGIQPNIIDLSHSADAINWCKEHFGECGYIWDSLFGNFYFENKEDCAMFKLAWL